MNIIILLLQLVNTHNLTPRLVSVCDELGKKEWYTISCSLFEWLQWQKRSEHNKPLVLKLEYTWCQNILKLLDSSEDFRELFELTDDGKALQFHKNISEEERNQIRDLVFDGYKPPFFT